ncbi:putative ethanolamine-phosphate cytidylyltransferase [Cucumispora dikerogammari]|nr:putative ethanolamine-phosphate cytidylyltransferase [Cucumispora dikerogammari]
MFIIQKILDLKAELITLSENAFADGCYDCLHLGHANSFRKMKNKTSCLIVGTHDDDLITSKKGATLMTENERREMLKHVRWVDVILPDQLPYSPNIKELINKGIKAIFHGTDDSVKTQGMNKNPVFLQSVQFFEVSRTEEFSTTDLLKKIYSFVSLPSSVYRPNLSSKKLKILNDLKEKFAKKILQESFKSKVIYVDGTFDLLNPRDLQFLEKARALGDYLIVGIHSDEAIKVRKGTYPIQCLLEREITLMGFKHGDKIVTAVPYLITYEYLLKLGVHCVAVRYNDDRYEHFSKIIHCKKIETEFDYFTDDYLIKKFKNNIKDYKRKIFKNEEQERSK